MKNSEFVEMYAGGFRGVAVNGHCGIIGERFFNYSTCLCEIVDGVAYLNDMRYSNTTSRIQGYLLGALTRAGYRVEKITPPESWHGGIWNWGELGAPRLTPETLERANKYTRGVRVDPGCAIH